MRGYLTEASVNVDAIYDSLKKAEAQVNKACEGLLDLADMIDGIKSQAIAAGGKLAEVLPSNLQQSVQTIVNAVNEIAAVTDDNNKTSLPALRNYVDSIPYKELTSTPSGRVGRAEQFAANRSQISADEFTPQQGMGSMAARRQQPQQPVDAYNESYQPGRLDFNQLNEQLRQNEEEMSFDEIQAQSLQECLAGNFAKNDISDSEAYDTSFTKMQVTEYDDLTPKFL